jgi:hypothetical protein
MTAHYRSLAARLLAALKTWSPAGGGPLEGAEEQYEAALIVEAEAALAQAEPEGVTDEEIEREALKNADSDDEYRAFKSGAFFVQERISRPTIEPVPVSKAEIDELTEQHCSDLGDLRIGIAPEDVPALVAAVLARHGHPTTEPVPVAERLPGPEDCDAKGRCWWFSPPACGPHKIRPCWTLDSEVMEGDTHWLPHNALPVPGAEVG